MSASRITEPVLSQFVADRAERLDQAIARYEHVSVAAARRLLAVGAVRVNGRRAVKGLQLCLGDEVSLFAIPESAERLRPVAEPTLPLRVLYEDPWLVAVEKPSGCATHPLRAGETGTLANALVARFPECLEASADPREAGFVHRLDGGTSGVMLAARDRETFGLLRAQFSQHRVEKTYVALVEGALTSSLVVRSSILHDPSDRRRVCVVPEETEGSQEAETQVSPLSQHGAFSLVEARSRFGRMHQIRAHLASIGLPLLGDSLYGAKVACPLQRSFFLHAARLVTSHPRQDGRPLVLVSPHDEMLLPWR